MTHSTRERWLALLIALVVVAIAIYGYLADSPPADIAETELRMPTGKPLLEPDRPDLIGEPGIENDNEEHEDIPDE